MNRVGKNVPLRVSPLLLGGKASTPINGPTGRPKLLRHLTVRSSKRDILPSHNQNPLYPHSVIGAKVPEITGQQVRRPDTDRREQYGPVLVGQLRGREERVIRRGSGENNLDGAE